MYIFVLVNKYHKKTKANNALVHLSMHSDFQPVSAPQPTDSYWRHRSSKICQQLRNFIFKKGLLISLSSWAL